MAEVHSKDPADFLHYIVEVMGKPKRFAHKTNYF